MIAKIDVTHFGIFKDYDWDTAISKTESFKKMNIIYGRNYSGKTTLSRIFKCVEDSLMHKNYAICEFKLTLENGTIITQSNLSEFAIHNKLRIYNTDFVKENLGWLHREDGTIKPFTILGAANVELEKQITEISERLGSVNLGSGLLFELSQEEVELDKQVKANKSRSNDLEEKLRRRASDSIKTNDTLFVMTNQKKSYAINDIKAEIEQIGGNIEAHLQDDANIIVLTKILKEGALDDINPLNANRPKFAENVNAVEKLLKQQIAPSKPIADLINDSLLQEWVRQGIDKHKGKRETCGFCGNVLSPTLWDKLDQHFSKESEELRSSINLKIAELENAKIGLFNFISIKRNHFYATLQDKFDTANLSWETARDVYSNNIDILITALKLRDQDVFRVQNLPDVIDSSEGILDSINGFNELLTEHNRKTSTLAKDKDSARKKLRFAHIAKYIRDIDYHKTLTDIKTEDERLSGISQTINSKRNEIRKFQEIKKNLEAQAKDESKGAELVNQHLSHYFGNSELKLVAEGEQPNVKFSIHRDSIPASNLSEGECSLISFCYFIAKIEDELKDTTNSDRLIIYIDDPISSLDSNHIFFMFSLIENVIAKPKEYGQLFISTHNLEFLKYLKKLTAPKKNLGHFIIERRSKSNSYLKIAPGYLKNYITEFNYLFDQIYQCSIGDREIVSHNYQYSFGNNMRKFLESYTFYKYPTHNLTYEQRLQKYFAGDGITYTLISRITNEFSHMEDQFDRGMHPIDMDEITRVSAAVIERIRTNDPDQFDALMDSVNQVA